jgi:hypothetical protein
MEPVSIGGRFRTGGVTHTTTAQARTNSVQAVTAAYKGGEQTSYTHQRTCYTGPEWLLVWENIDAEDSSFTSRLHAHPAVSIRDASEDRFYFTHNEGPQIVCQPFNIAATNIRSAPYFPRFGEALNRDVLSLHSRSPRFGYLLTRCDTNARVEVQTPFPVRLYLGKQCYQLPEVDV